jgi:hypothetical protein
MLIMEALLLAGICGNYLSFASSIQINFLSLWRAKKCIVVMRQKPSPNSIGLLNNLVAPQRTIISDALKL